MDEGEVGEKWDTKAELNGTKTVYGYDDLDRLTDEHVTNTTTNEPIFVEHFDLGDNGQRADVIDTRYNT